MNDTAHEVQPMEPPERNATMLCLELVNHIRRCVDDGNANYFEGVYFNLYQNFGGNDKEGVVAFFPDGTTYTIMVTKDTPAQVMPESSRRLDS